MIFQRILKGIANISRSVAAQQLAGGGITCNWWRRVNPLPEAEIPERLTEQNLFRHLNAYDQIDSSLAMPYGLYPFGQYTPFISTTAGTVERDPTIAHNLTFSAFLTALSFATAQFSTYGVVYYGYVNILGRQAIALREFAEETRDLHQWTAYQPYHSEGEVVAKISIPSPHLEKAEGYDGPVALAQLIAGSIPIPTWVENNHTHYVAPETISNVRGYL